MSHNPLVSVIIPTYKRVDFLERAIKSVLNQTYRNIEIIVVDDNNPDTEYRLETSKLMKNYMSLYSNIKYLLLDKNSGGCVARNTGLKESTGKYVNFLDDDDMFYPEKIEKQVIKFESSNEDLAVVGCFANIKDNDGNVKRVEKVEVKGDVFLKQLAYNVCTTSIALINREICIKSGGFIKIPSSQEHLFFIKIFEVNPYYDYVSEPLIDIIHHDGERVSNNINKPLGAIELFNYVKTYFNKLDENKIKSISIEHYENILRSFLVAKDRKKSIVYLEKIIKENGFMNKRVLKLSILIFLGIENTDKIKKWVSIK